MCGKNVSKCLNGKISVSLVKPIMRMCVKNKRDCIVTIKVI